MNRPCYLAALLVVAALASACSSGSGGEVAKRDVDGNIVQEHDALAEDLRIGDCFSDYVDPLTAETMIGAVHLTTCGAPHTYELYHKLTAGAELDPWPGEDALTRQLTEACAVAFEAYVGVARSRSRLGSGIFYPTEEGWSGYGREAYCYLFEGFSPMIGSMRNSHR